MCYQVRALPQQPPHVWTTDQFGSDDDGLFGIRDLCVPLIAGPGTCGDGKLNAPGEECEVDNAEPLCGDGVINGNEECDESTDGCPSNPNETCTPDCTCDCVPLAQCLPGFCGSAPDGCGSTLPCDCPMGLTCDAGICIL